MSTIHELVARLAEQMAELWNDRHDRAKSTFTRQTFAQFAEECVAIAAEARATGQGPRVESPSGTWTLTTDPDCPRAWEHHRDDGTVDSLVYADEVVQMYRAQTGQGQGIGCLVVAADKSPDVTSPAPADDVETVRRALTDAAYSDEGCDGQDAHDALKSLDRLAAPVATAILLLAIAAGCSNCWAVPGCKAPPPPAPKDTVKR